MEQYNELNNMSAAPQRDGAPDFAAEEPTKAAPESTAFRAEPQPEPTNEKPRRVGTLTLGLMLITVGALLVGGVFVPELSWQMVLRFSPAMLIFLGIEVLIASAHPDAKLKYDWLSVVFCLLVLAGAGAAKLVEYQLNEQSIYNQREVLCEQLKRETFEALHTACPQVNDVSVAVWPIGNLLWEQGVPEKVDGRFQVKYYCTLCPGAQTAEAFAQSCAEVLARADAAGLPDGDWRFDVLYIEGSYSGPVFNLETEGIWQRSQSAEQLAERVETSYYSNGTWYSREGYEQKARAEEDSGEPQELLTEEDISQEDDYEAAYAQGYREGLLEAMELNYSQMQQRAEEVAAVREGEALQEADAGWTDGYCKALWEATEMSGAELAARVRELEG